MITKEIFAKGIGHLVTFFKNAEMPAETIKLWHQELKDFDPRVFERVIKDLARTSKFFPAFSEIYQAMCLHSGFANAGGDEKWTQILRAAETGEKPELDEITERALEAAGGWDQIQFTPYKELTFLRKHFVSAYDSLKQKAGGGQIGIEGPALKAIEGGK